VLAGLEDDGVPGTFTLKAIDSVEVAVTPRRVHYWNYELVPAEALEPNTAYELTGSWLVDTEVVGKTIRFTTGAGPLEDAPAKPSARIEHYQLTGSEQSSCNPAPTGSCLSFGDYSLVEYAHVDTFNQVGEPYLARSAAMTNLSGVDQGTSYECVQLRTRAMNGTYSEAQTLCRDDGELYQLTSIVPGCTVAGLTSDGTPVVDVPDAGDDAAPPSVDAGTTGDPRGDDDASDSEMSEQQAAPAVSSSSCSVTRVAAGVTHAPGSWGLCIALIGLLCVRRRARAGR
jgi:hypothetical protein